MNNNDFGITYIATGKNYRFECLQSAISAKEVMPDIPISLWTDSKSGLDIKCFDYVHIISDPKNDFFDKILPLTKTEYKKLFLDADTFLLYSVYEISELLEKFELACCHALNRIPFKNHVIKEIPICFNLILV